MGDGAAAIILARDNDRAGPRLSHVYYGQMGRGRAPGLAVADGGSDIPSCSVGFPEFRHDFAAIHRSGLELLLHCAAAAERTGSGPADYVLPHQANGRMDTILAGPLGVAPERIVVTADRLGNTGSAAIWLALAQLRPTLKPGRRLCSPWVPRPPTSCSAGSAITMPDHARRCSAAGRRPPCGRELLVAVDDISKRYGRTTAVAGVTLALWSGEICGFIGANGAGKTTILRMLAGILKPDGGGGQVLGFDLQRDAAAIRERVGYMSQRLSLYRRALGIRKPPLPRCGLRSAESARGGRGRHLRVRSRAVGPQPRGLALRGLGAPASARCVAIAFAASRAPR